MNFKSWWKLFVLAIAMFALVAVVGCGEGEEEAPAEEAAVEEAPAEEAQVEEAPAEEAPVEETAEPIILGVGGAHSGDLAPFGLPSINAAELVAEKFNASGGVLGRDVVVLPEDDQCKPEIATNVAYKLVDENVNFVVGHICSGATNAAMPIYTDNNIIVMSPSATNPPLTQSGDNPTFFRTIASDDIQAKLAVDFAVEALGVTKVAILHDKGDYGKGFAEFAQTFLAEYPDVEEVLFEGITPGGVDYSAVILKVEQAGADCVIFGGYHPEASKLVQQMRERGMETAFVSDDGVQGDAFIEVAGEFAEGVYATGPKDFTSNAMYQAVTADHVAKYGEEPGMFFYEGYSAALCLLSAMQSAGTTDSDAIMEKLRSEPVETPLGPIYFDEKGDAIGVGFSVYQVQDGVYVELDYGK
ncbi:MAG: branched-chain amino acid ABC transporter substrate-binding protein [Desulfovibrio sp.]|nr:MAG: branched-chain amino acid ABC transporter substrate-binding protein [Desulfovibrio sp.]